MTTEEFNKLSKPDSLNGAREAIRQAKALHQLARNAADSQNYGIANSLMILSVEESIKSMILLAGYFSITLTFEIKPFFSIHSAKHDQASGIQPMINLVWKVRNLFVFAFKKRGNLLTALVGIIVLQAVDKFTGNSVPENFNEWWKNANNQKK